MNIYFCAVILASGLKQHYTHIMKILVLYYSYGGTTERIAKVIGDELGADIERICVADEKNRKGFSKYFFGGMQALLKKEPVVEPLSSDPEGYDMIIIGTPVWAGTCAPAIRTILHRYSFSGKRTAFFYTHQGGPGHTEADLLEAVQGSVCVGSLSLCNVVQGWTEAEQLAKTWCKNSILTNV